ncbi:unnamed protein product [Albugo candida]|uniref:histidine--tRNA ligase n=3 Tax=Albugo candida TaxID=65357 RepID=A0A024FYC8_9STRA|nr:unnamed protein product [Albugo candida]|eukprot:CCI39308.1 unnamed protein product [Albugo candida]
MNSNARQWVNYNHAFSRSLCTFRRVRGMKDLYGEEIHRHEFVSQTLHSIVTRYGFQKIQTPVVEYTNLYTRSLGADSDIVNKEMYTFQDKSGDSVSLRPEGTAGVIRALRDGNLVSTLPRKVFYIGNMYRYERPQRGRFREFQQFGVEYVGCTSPSVDVEVLMMADRCLRALGMRERTELHINTLGDAESRLRYKQALGDYFSSRLRLLSSDSQLRFERGNILRILDSKNHQDQDVISSAPSFDQYLSRFASERFEAVQSGLQELGVDFVHNSRLVRGLDYYCDTVFEFVEKDQSSTVKMALFAGGCYESLMVSVGGSKLLCIGWAAGIDRLCLLSNLIPSSTTSLFIISLPSASRNLQPKAFEIAEKLREQGLIVHLSHGNDQLKKQLKTADRLKCDYTVFLGDQEFKAAQVRVKNMQSGEQQTIAWSQLDQIYSQLIRPAK